MPNIKHASGCENGNCHVWYNQSKTGWQQQELLFTDHLIVPGLSTILYIVCILYFVYMCRSTSSERETETESLSCAMDTGETTQVEDTSSDIEYSEDTTADDGNY